MSVIGIDPSVVAPAVAVWPSCDTWQFKIGGAGSERLYRLGQEMKKWATRNRPADLDAIFIERPTGRFPVPDLTRACGVIEAAMYGSFSSIYRYPVPIFRLSPPEWKKEVLDSGKATKLDVFHWAAPLAPKTLTQDEADALAIARAGHSLLERGEAAA